MHIHMAGVGNFTFYIESTDDKFTLQVCLYFSLFFLYSCVGFCVCVCVCDTGLGITKTTKVGPTGPEC